MVNKYQRLANHLASLRTSPWVTTFAEVEAVMGEELPLSARKHRPWWANSGAESQSAAWMTVGWKTARVDLAAETVVFTRSAAARPAAAGAARREEQTAPPPAEDAEDAGGPANRGIPRERLRELMRPLREPAENAGPDDALEAVAALLEHADPAEQRVLETLSRVALAGQARRVADSLEIMEDLLVETATGGGN